MVWFSHRCVMISSIVIVMMAGVHPTVTNPAEEEVSTAALHRLVRSHSLNKQNTHQHVVKSISFLISFLLDYSLRNGLLIFFLLVVPILVGLVIILLYVFRRDSFNRCVKCRPSKSQRSINHHDFLFMLFQSWNLCLMFNLWCFNIAIALFIFMFGLPCT